MIKQHLGDTIDILGGGEQVFDPLVPLRIFPERVDRLCLHIEIAGPILHVWEERAKRRVEDRFHVGVIKIPDEEAGLPACEGFDKV